MKLTIELPEWIETNILDTHDNQEGRLEMYKSVIAEFLDKVKEDRDLDFIDLLEGAEEHFDEDYEEFEDEEFED